ncbi:uncharacterized protein LOC124255334 [Haliotis rubra]|uniref:uncharacterized protein LOC124255334 n=1 Tax=Haliotis rubra TaxID=36100 RepID=UPI001EE5749E|nr:uncharacterized protein LOC124255334 [Haliotis rubra]XP_046545186.1 uncharacterized protein LOC124255334 [Haliotis rubra]
MAGAGYMSPEDMRAAMVGMHQKMDALNMKIEAMATEVRAVSNKLSIMEQGTVAGAQAVPAATPPDSQHDIKQAINFASSYSPMSRIRFVGIKEMPGENVDEVLRKFLIATFGIEEAQARTMPMTCFRLARMSGTPEGSPGDILITFNSVHDKNKILTRASKISKTLMAMNIGIMRWQ